MNKEQGTINENQSDRNHAQSGVNDLQSYINNDNEGRLKWLEDRYSTFNEEFGYVKANVDFLVKFFWLLLGTSLTSVAGIVVMLIKMIIQK